MHDIVIVGCGAVAEHGHIPAAKKVGAQIVGVVDPNLQRARALVPEATVTASLDDALELATYFVVASPHRFHADAATLLARSNKRVLVEKPLHISEYQSGILSKLTISQRRHLTMAMIRRLQPGFAVAKRLIIDGAFGTLQSVTIKEGSVYSWPVTTASFWDRELAGGGVLVDVGSHVLDLIYFLLGDIPQVVQHFDDSCGGVEANSETIMRNTGGTSVKIVLSRTRPLGPSLELSFSGRSVIIASTDGRELAGGGTKSLLGVSHRSLDQLFAIQMERWLSGAEEELADFDSGLAVSRTIQEAYRIREPLRLPWEPQRKPASE